MIYLDGSFHFLHSAIVDEMFYHVGNHLIHWWFPPPKGGTHPATTPSPPGYWFGLGLQCIGCTSKLSKPSCSGSGTSFVRPSRFKCSSWDSAHLEVDLQDKMLGGSSRLESGSDHPIYKPWNGRWERGTTILSGRINHGYLPRILTGMIPQIQDSKKKN